jgi:hypothetical protein
MFFSFLLLLFFFYLFDRYLASVLARCVDNLRHLDLDFTVYIDLDGEHSGYPGADPILEALRGLRRVQTWASTASNCARPSRCSL